MPITLIYTRTDKWLLSKEEVDWKVWQDKLYWFTASLSFENIQLCADFLKEDFHLNEHHKNYIIETVSKHENKTFELSINEYRDLKLLPLQLCLLESKGKTIDWADWTYSFTQRENNYELWVYLGGIAEETREIRLNDQQVKHWEEQGNEYIRQIVKDLQRKNSEIYLEAIKDNRKIL